MRQQTAAVCGEQNPGGCLAGRAVRGKPAKRRRDDVHAGLREEQRQERGGDFVISLRGECVQRFQGGGPRRDFRKERSGRDAQPGLLVSQERKRRRAKVVTEGARVQKFALRQLDRQRAHVGDGVSQKLHEHGGPVCRIRLEIDATRRGDEAPVQIIETLMLAAGALRMAGGDSPTPFTLGEKLRLLPPAGPVHRCAAEIVAACLANEGLDKRVARNAASGVVNQRGDDRTHGVSGLEESEGAERFAPRGVVRRVESSGKQGDKGFESEQRVGRHGRGVEESGGEGRRAVLLDALPEAREIARPDRPQEVGGLSAVGADLRRRVRTGSGAILQERPCRGGKRPRRRPHQRSGCDERSPCWTGEISGGRVNRTHYEHRAGVGRSGFAIAAAGE